MEAYGVRVGIRVSDPSILPEILGRLAPCWKPTSRPVVYQIYSLVVGGPGRNGVRRFHLLYGSSQRLARTLDLAQALDRFEDHVEMYLAETTPRRIFVHAGVVGWRGRVLLVPGASHSGKSTLVATLLRAGATYYSDEYAVIDPRGRVHPYPRVLKFRNPDGGQVKLPLEALGAALGRRAAPVGLVAVLRYEAGGRWRVRPVSPGKALLALLKNTIIVRVKPEAAVATLRQVVSNATAVEGVRGDADDAAPLLLGLLEGASPRPTPAPSPRLTA